MAKVLIVAKTKMGGNGVCVGGLVLSSNQNIRLLTSVGLKQPIDTKYAIGQWWDLDFQPIATPILPHSEDVIVRNGKYIGHQKDLRALLMERVNVWKGGFDQLFDGCLASENQSCFIPEYITPPNMSTGFWLPNVRLEQAKNPRYYMLHTNSVAESKYSILDQSIYIPYVGFEQALDMIPIGTLVRVSLARWFNKRCYLQISGWYM